MPVSQDQVIEQAKAGLGVPYVWGKNGPDAWDCSGFVLWVLRASIVVSEEFPDMTARDIYVWGVREGRRITVPEAFNMGAGLVYRASGGRINHIGFSTRGFVIEARGQDYGTIMRDNPGTFTHATTIPGVIG